MTQSWDAKQYEDAGQFVHEAARNLVEQLDPRPAERVLTLGCGTGHLSAEIATHGSTVVGVDSDPEMLAAARDRYPGLEFVEADIRDVRFEKPFDAVFSNAALHWVSKAEAVVETIATALHPGGRFVAEFGGQGNVEQIVTAVRSAVSAGSTASESGCRCSVIGCSKQFRTRNGRRLSRTSRAVLADVEDRLRP